MAEAQHWNADIQAFLDTRNFTAAIEACEQLEISREATPEAIALLMTLYLINGDTENALFLWKRTPLVLKESHPEINALHVFTTSIMRDPIALPALGLISFPVYLHATALVLQDVLRQKALALLGKCYKVIELNHLATSLCVTPEQAATSAAEWGWVYDATTNTCVKQATSSEDTATNGVKWSPGISLQQLTSVIKILER